MVVNTAIPGHEVLKGLVQGNTIRAKHVTSAPGSRTSVAS